ncbi:MAG: hypothetical protein AB8B87_25755 [Granulosicoccus sp.]
MSQFHNLIYTDRAPWHGRCLRGKKDTQIPVLAALLALITVCVSSGVRADNGANLFFDERTIAGIGIGGGHAQVLDSQSRLQLEGYTDENGFSLNLRLASEIPIGPYFAFQGGVDLFSSASAASLFSSTASYGASITAGIILGKVAAPLQPYLSLGYGVGAVALSDQGPDTGCIVCSGDSGGAAAGAASRVALGMTTQGSARLELVWIRAGGDGNDYDFPVDADAYLDIFLVVLSSYGY